MIGRRVFFRTLLAGFTVDPERLLWIPGAKTISVPNPIQVVIPLRDRLIRQYVIGKQQLINSWSSLPDTENHRQWIARQMASTEATIRQELASPDWQTKFDARIQEPFRVHF